MSERNLLAACIKSRSAYATVSQYLGPDSFTPEGRIILDVVSGYYERDRKATEVVPLETFLALVKKSVSNPKHKDQLGGLAESIFNLKVSPENVVLDTLTTREEAAGQRLAQVLVGGERDSKELSGSLEEYLHARAAVESGTLDEESKVSVGWDAEELLEAVADPKSLIRILPKALNDRLDGGCLRGHHMVVYGRPEVGKTLFVLNLIYGFLKQGLTVLYFGNEDPLADIKTRLLGRINNKIKYDIVSNMHDAVKSARSMPGKMIWYHATPGTVREIDEQCVEHKPDVVVLDQLRNLNVYEDQYVVKLEKAAAAARNIGKKHHCFMVSVTQAGDSADGKAILEMGDVDSSNTGIPGATDIMVGIGATKEDLEIGRRVLSLPKNKRCNDHSSFPVTIDPTTGKIISGG